MGSRVHQGCMFSPSLSVSSVVTCEQEAACQRAEVEPLRPQTCVFPLRVLNFCFCVFICHTAIFETGIAYY